MTTTHRHLLAALFAAVASAGLLAQTAPTPPGSAATGTTNSGGVAPTTGKPTTTPTGPTEGGTGSGVGLKPTTPVVGGNITTTTPTTKVGGTTTTNATGNTTSTVGGNTTTTTTGNTTTTVGGNTTTTPLGGNKTTTTVGGNTTTSTPGNTTATGPGKSGKGPNANSSQNAKDVHAAVVEFQAARKDHLASRKAIIEKLKAAETAEKRQEAITELRAFNTERAAEERAMGKQIRDELKGLRDARKSGGT